MTDAINQPRDHGIEVQAGALSMLSKQVRCWMSLSILLLLFVAVLQPNAIAQNQRSSVNLDFAVRKVGVAPTSAPLESFVQSTATTTRIDLGWITNSRNRSHVKVVARLSGESISAAQVLVRNAGEPFVPLTETESRTVTFSTSSSEPCGSHCRLRAIELKCDSGPCILSGAMLNIEIQQY
jgi:hypothetical protein